MRISKLLVRALGAGLLGCGSAAAQSVHRYDMGSAASPVAAGFTPVTAQSTYSSAQGHGWLPGPTPVESVRPAPHPHVAHVVSADLLRDAIASSSALTFRQDLPAGEYGCVVLLGDLGAPGGVPKALTPLKHMMVRANGVAVAVDVAARTGQGKATFDNAWGGYKRVSFVCQTNASGQLDLEFSSSSGGVVSVMAVETYPRLRPPVSFSHSTNTLVAAPLYQTLLTNFLGQFNAHRYVRARLELDAIPSSTFNDLGKAWGYAWIAGWLTGDEVDVDTGLLAQIKTLLDGLDPDDFRVAILRQDRDHFAKGELFLRTRGYSSAEFLENPESTGELLWNLCAGAQLLEQLDDDILLSSPLAYRPDSPFFPKAQHLLARSMYGRNVRLALDNGVYSFVEFNKQIVSILDALWLRLDPAVSGPARLFPKAVDATVLSFYVRSLLPPGSVGELTPWINTPLPHPIPPVDYNSTWFKTLTEFTSPFTAPAWAEHQWRYARLSRMLGAWWVDKRKRGAELGGGIGDDVEGAAGLALQSLVKTEGARHPLEGGLHSVLDGALFGPEVDASQGFYYDPNYTGHPPGGLMDSAHAGEYTSFPLAVLLPSNIGNPRYFEFAMRTVRNMIEPPHPILGDTAWTGIPGWSNWRRFKAFRLGAYGYEQPLPGGPNVDMDSADNMRVIAPGFFLLDHSGLQRARELWYEYGRAWAAAAMHDGTGYALPKPRGIFPVGIDYQTGVFGEANEWWTNSQQNSGSVGGHGFYLYSLLLTAFRTSSEPYLERRKLLEPIQRAVEFLASTTPNPNAPRGSAEWTAAATLGSIAQIAFTARRELVVDMAMSPAQLDAVIDTYAPPLLRYLNAPPSPAGKDKSAIAAQFEQDALWLRRFWPMATTVVSYTDRIPIDVGGSNFALFQALGGAYPIAAPTNFVSWSLPQTAPTRALREQTLDTAILLNELRLDSSAAQPLTLKALLFHFGANATAIDLRVWRGLPHGQYRVDIGPDANEDDRLDSVSTSLTVELDGRDDLISIPSIPAGQLTVVDLVWTGPPTSSVTPELDLGLSREDLVDFIGATQVTVHNLGNANFTPVSGANVELYDDLTGVLLASAPLPAIPAPVELNPSSATVTLAHSVVPGRWLRAALKFPAGVTQITLANDSAIAQL